MGKPNNPPQRICPRLMEDMERILKTRVGNGLMNIRDARMPKATELLTRTNGYRLSLKELEMKPEKKKMNKKGEILESFGLIIGFFILIAIILAVGFFIVMGSSVINMVADEVVPVINDIQTVGDTNITQAANYVVTPVNSTIQNFTWLSGVFYMIAILGLFGFAFSYRVTANKALIPLFFLIAFLMIICSIVFSNIYQDFYQGTDSFAGIMQEHGLLSYLILNSPMIFTVLIFVSGIVMFTGVGQEMGGTP